MRTIGLNFVRIRLRRAMLLHIDIVAQSAYINKRLRQIEQLIGTGWRMITLSNLTNVLIRCDP